MHLVVVSVLVVLVVLVVVLLLACGCPGGGGVPGHVGRGHGALQRQGKQRGEGQVGR